MLPFVHQGQGAAYQTSDWKDYLPTAAGGRGGQAHQPVPVGAAQTGAGGGAGVAAQQQLPQLGAILYARDSADENGGLHDSDEDPDDDLDI